MQECRQVPSTYTILDNNIFQSLVREIKYFAGLNMLSDDDIEVIKDGTCTTGSSLFPGMYM